MPLCNRDCAANMPIGYGGACKVITRPAGIKLIFFIACSVDVSILDFTQQSTWDTLCQNGELAVSGKLLASKPKGTFTKKKLISCAPEMVTGGEKMVNFTDPNSDPNGGTAVHEFWNQVLLNSASYYFGFITCDNDMYLIEEDFSIEVDEDITEDNKNNRDIQGTISWNQIDIVLPVKLPTNLTFDCDSSSILIP